MKNSENKVTKSDNKVNSDKSQAKKKMIKTIAITAAITATICATVTIPSIIYLSKKAKA